MKLGYFADGPWSHKALDRIVKSKVLEVSFIVARYDTVDPVLREYAKTLGVPFYIHPNVNAADFLETVRSHEPEILVSMSFNQILKAEILNLAPKGFVNCHAGALPFYRGRNILNWVLINGEDKFGVTVHYIDEGIDTGDIILQRFSTINDDDDYGTLLDKAIDICGELLPEALELIACGNDQRIPQSTIHEVGFYCSQRRPGDERIQWSLSSQRIHNFVRGITLPGPGARTVMTGKQVAILKSEIIDGAINYYDKPGNVVGKDATGIIVKTGDSVLHISKVADVTATGDLVDVRVPKFRIGTHLESCP